MYISFSLPIAAILCFALALVAIIIISIISWRRQWIVRRQFRLSGAGEEPEPQQLPKASVILFTRDEPQALARNLPKLLHQDYPSGFEVIVVNDGASPDTNMVVGSLKSKYDNIYLTFTPDGVRNLSRKKLALTLGVKAAKGEVVVITDADSVANSDKWLATLLRSFADPSTGVVLGYGVAQAESRPLTSAFDHGADCVAWLSAAISGHPYRGCAYNVAYRRNLFFENKGFAASINMRNGDDDVFISQIADASNCHVELGQDAIMVHETYNFKREVKDDRIAHAFTGRKLWKGSRRALACAQWLMWASLALCCSGAVLSGIANAAGWIVCAALAIAMLAGAGWSWTLTMKALRLPSVSVLLPFQAMCRPLRNIIVGIMARSEKAANFTWQ